LTPTNALGRCRGGIDTIPDRVLEEEDLPSAEELEEIGREEKDKR